MSAAPIATTTHENATSATHAAPSLHARRTEGSESKGKQHHRQTMTYGLSAFENIIQSKLPADPPSYEVWYEYARGDNPVLNAAIDAIVERNQSVSAGDLSQLHKRFFSVTLLADRIETVSRRMDGAISGILTALDVATLPNGRHHADLDGMTEALNETPDHAALQALIGGLVTATAEMEKKNEDLSACLSSSVEEITKLRADLAIIRAESITDPLTALANRKHFDSMLNEAVAQYECDRQPFSLLLCDIDHFKTFNDTFGHPTGDRVLTLVGTVLKQSVRGQGTPARYGGEEFAIILPNTSLPQARTVGENIRNAISKSELVKRSTGESLGRITISVGVAEFERDDTAQSLIDRADSCLYEAKRQGRDRVVA